MCLHRQADRQTDTDRQTQTRRHRHRHAGRIISQHECENFHCYRRCKRLNPFTHPCPTHHVSGMRDFGFLSHWTENCGLPSSSPSSLLVRVASGLVRPWETSNRATEQPRRNIDWWEGSRQQGVQKQQQQQSKSGCERDCSMCHVAGRCGTRHFRGHLVGMVILGMRVSDGVV